MDIGICGSSVPVFDSARQKRSRYANADTAGNAAGNADDDTDRNAYAQNSDSDTSD